MKTKQIPNLIGWLRLIPITNVLLVLLVIGHVYFIDVNMGLLILLVMLYIIITSMIICKHKITYNLLEVQYSKLGLIFTVLIGLVTMIIMLLLYDNFDVVGIIIGLAVGMFTHLIHQMICLN